MNRSRIVCCALLLVAGSVFAADIALPDLFKRAKEKFAAGDYKSSLADFDQLDAMTNKPGLENDRAKLFPVITFYRGANFAALGQKNEAKNAFVTYLGFMPAAAIASPPFPKTTVDLFEQARKEARGRMTTMSSTYLAFAIPPGWTLATDEHWAETPVRYLLTPVQKKEYSTLTTHAERAAFVDAFWKQLDPTPGTDANEFRNEFERRLAYADASFGTEKTQGRYSDRAAVFTFLGAPTFASMANVSSDTMTDLRSNDSNGEMRGNMRTTLPSGGGVKNSLDQAYQTGTRESWTYRQDRMPKDVAYQEVRFDFLTKQGYGFGVLQKDPQPMQLLGQAADLARANHRLN
jgi:GWxTD domain-containing protein